MFLIEIPTCLWWTGSLDMAGLEEAIIPEENIICVHHIIYTKQYGLSQ